MMPKSGDIFRVTRTRWCIYSGDRTPTWVKEPNKAILTVISGPRGLNEFLIYDILVNGCFGFIEDWMLTKYSERIA